MLILIAHWFSMNSQSHKQDYRSPFGRHLSLAEQFVLYDNDFLRRVREVEFQLFDRY